MNHLSLQKKTKSKHLYFSPLQLKHAPFILELLNTKEWLQYIGNINNIHDALQYIQNIQEKENTYYWVIKLKENKLPIGILTLLKRSNFEFHDIGFAFLKAHCGKGYAYEATNTLIKIIKTTTNLQQIKAITLPNNLKSIQLLKKLNFKPEKQININNETLLQYTLSLNKINHTNQ